MRQSKSLRTHTPLPLSAPGAVGSKHASRFTAHLPPRWEQLAARSAALQNSVARRGLLAPPVA